MASDYVSGTLRRLLQDRFGDAGHGFALIANAWPAYFHNDIERYATAGWKVSRVVGPLSDDGLYGLGCVSFRAEKNVLARFGTAKKGDFGRNVSRFGISYLAEPAGGTFEVRVDGAAHGVVDTHAQSKQSRVYEVTLGDGPHELEIMTKSGNSRLFGVTLERDVPGVVLDAIGIQGARVRFLDKQDDAHWAEQLAARHPNLLVYQFGANESADGLLYPMADYRRTMREVLEQGKRAVPEASCLVIGVMDRATKQGEELKSLRIIPRLLAEQRAVASELGCAFFDTYRAMGGEGSMPSWVKRGLGQADLTHPSSIGADMIGTWIFRALMQRYRELSSDAAAAAPSPSSDANVNSPSRR
ncbi:MAG: GDSL-type esterase/lipase family protein [Polyangiaceae bacterium]